MCQQLMDCSPIVLGKRSQIDDSDVSCKISNLEEKIINNINHSMGIKEIYISV